MKYTHGIGMLFTGLEFNDCLSARATMPLTET
jgi:hypothetical protein